MLALILAPISSLSRPFHLPFWILSEVQGEDEDWHASVK